MTTRRAAILFALLCLTAFAVGYQVTAMTHHPRPTFAEFPLRPNDPDRPSCWAEPSEVPAGFEVIYYPHLSQVPMNDPGFEVNCPTNSTAAKEVGG